MKKITLLSLVLFATPLFAQASIRENGGRLSPAAAKIEFYSPGDGIDTELKTAVDALIQEYKAAGLVKTYSEKLVGREGETNVCVQLVDLKSSQKLNRELVELIKGGQHKTSIKFTSSCE